MIIQLHFRPYQIIIHGISEIFTGNLRLQKVEIYSLETQNLHWKLKNLDRWKSTHRTPHAQLVSFWNGVMGYFLCSFLLLDLY